LIFLVTFEPSLCTLLYQKFVTISNLFVG
jgi:hypothetical protein